MLPASDIMYVFVSMKDMYRCMFEWNRLVDPVEIAWFSENVEIRANVNYVHSLYTDVKRPCIEIRRSGLDTTWRSRASCCYRICVGVRAANFVWYVLFLLSHGENASADHIFYRKWRESNALDGITQSSQISWLEFREKGAVQTI